MIKLASERVFPLTKGPDHVPRLRGEKKVHRSTMSRWSKYGVRAEDGEIVFLETIRVGRTTCTSADAIQRFCERLSGGSSTANPPRTTVPPTRATKAASDEAERIFGQRPREGA